VARSKLDGALGDRLGPKLSSLVVQHTLAVRRALGPLEARWRQAATQAVIDQAGEEMATLYQPLTSRIIAERGDQLHPIMARHLQRVASGRHQWESVLGHAQMSFSGALGSTISNLVWPVTAEINRIDRNLTVDPQTGAAAVAAGLADYGTGDTNAGAYGYVPDAFQLWYQLAQTIPDAGTLAQLVNRGLLSEAEMTYWLQRAALPDELRGPVGQLRRLLLTPADAALGVLRGDIARGLGEQIAAENGLDAADFAILMLNTGEPPGAEQLAEALRRGFIDRATFETGIRQSRIRDEWIPTLLDLQYAPVPTADAIDASLRGWITADLARQIAQQNGVEPEQIQILLDNAGNPPSNEQLLELRRRGYIDDATLVRGIREGRTRDEWIPQIEQLAYEPLGTADALDGWLRGHIDDQQLDQLLNDNGLLERDWALAKANAGNPLALEQLLEALRRGFIDRDTFITGFRESRYRDEWAGTALQLGYSPLSTADALEAWLQGFIPESRARELAQQNGLEPADFDTLRDATGEPLSRTELQQLYNRHLIDLATYTQGLRESRLRDKWIPDALQLHIRLPEAFQILRWIEYGLVTQEQGLDYLGQIGYGPDVAQLMLAEGQVTATGPHKQLMASEVESLYQDNIITEEQAYDYLRQLHYTDYEINLMLQLAAYKQKQAILKSGIGMVRSHYLAGRIDDTAARADLLGLNLPSPTVDLYLQVWGYDKLAHPKQLTEAQIVKAANGNMLVPQGDLAQQDWATANQQAGCQRLVNLGYDVTDAKLLLAGA
jgi:hypothetical protein